MDFRITTLLDNRITLESGPQPSRVVGLDALVQEVLIELLSDPIPSKGRGAGVLAIASDFTFNDSAFISAVRQAVSTAQTHILANQAVSGSLNAEERLAELTYLSAGVVNGEWTLDVQVTNNANQTRTVSVPAGS